MTPAAWVLLVVALIFSVAIEKMAKKIKRLEKENEALKRNSY